MICLKIRKKPEREQTQKQTYVQNIRLIFCLFCAILKHRKGANDYGGLNMEKQPISAIQQKILDFLKEEIAEKGYPPTIREIGDGVNLKSTSSVFLHLNTLEKNGYIRRNREKPRAIEIVDNSFHAIRQNTEQIPIIGTVAAGQPILAEEYIEGYFPIPAEYLPKKPAFLLRIKGDSMINAGILNGDLVLVAKEASVDNGDMVVALIDDSATVKTFYREDGYFRLQPENDAMEPIIVKGKLDILGKIIGVMRFL